MHVKNETTWRTDDLRKLLRACIEHEGLDAGPREGWRIRIYYNNRAVLEPSGWAYLDSRTFRIGMPRAWRETRELTMEQLWRLARVIIHEVGHCKGLEHRDMVDHRTMDVGWVDPADYPVRLRQAAAPSKPSREQKARDAVVRLHALVAAEEKRHAAAMKNLRTRLRKAKNSVRYYDRKNEPKTTEGQ